jgi:hypothetical protein
MKMALNIELDGFEYLSDSDATKLSPKIKQPPISPIESESSSGISSLDSDELKKQSLSSPTISHDDEDQQSDGAVASTNGSERGDSRDADDEEEDEDENEQNDKSNDTTTTEDREVEGEKSSEVENDKKMQKVEVELTVPAPTMKSETYTPVKVMYQNRDILDLAQNIRVSGKLVQFAVLPDNNVNYFFQNRAQYWRLNSGGEEQERQTNDMENCPCCDFTYPSTTHFPKDQTKKPSANAISDSLICFLKTSEQMYASNSNANQSSNNVNVNVNYNGSGSLNNFIGKRSITNNVSQFAYPMQQQQPNFQQQQSYPLNNNGFNSSSNSFGQQQPPMNPFMNNSNSYGTTLALLSMMNNSCNAANAFRAMNNTQRYYNNNQSNMNGGFGLYKQF